MKVVRQQRAVSTVLSALILMAIVVVGAVVVYQIFLRNALVQNSDGRISVQGASLLMATSAATGTALFSITIENTGNKPVTSVQLTVNHVVQSQESCPPPSPPSPPQRPTFCLLAAAISPSNSLGPSQSTSATGTPRTDGSALMAFAYNSPYPYSVQVTFPDSSSYVVGGTVVASKS